MRTLVSAMLLAAAVAGGDVGAAAEPGAGAAFSPAERHIFAAPHLGNLPADATLHYRYRRNEAGRDAVDDEVVLTARGDAPQGRSVHVDFLNGERKLTLPDVENATSNPLILYFLEADVRDMHRRLGGQENYFRRRIRLALAEGAQVSDVAVRYAGRVVQATRVEVRPYENDELAARFRGMEQKAYQFTLSPEVPGGVYELRTEVAGVGTNAEPLFAESLTLRDDGSDGAPGEAPRAPASMPEGK